jgi:hypothetical protein
MNASEVAASPNSFEQRIVSVERGIRLFAVTILLLTSAPNLALALSIKSYAAAFPAMLRMPSISPVSQWLFTYPYFVVALAVLWPLAGIVITARAKDPFRAMIASCIYLVLVTVQFTITWLAFVAPIRALFSSLPLQ